MARWVLKPVELARATKKLGIKHPVSVRPYKSFWGGNYDSDPLHVLWVNKDVDKHWTKDPSRTIWHELAHALQCERDFGGDGDTWNTVMDKVYAQLIDDDDNPIFYGGEDYDSWVKRYFELPWEKEADEIANKYSWRYPLVRIIV